MDKLIRFTRNFNVSGVPLVRAYSDIIDIPDDPSIKIPIYSKAGESLEKKKARLMYQSRKRGMLENDLLLSTFAHKYLDNMDELLVDQYDKMINKPSNDWDIYNWGVGKNPVPEEYNNEVMAMFKEHVKNLNKENRTRMPNLH